MVPYRLAARIALALACVLGCATEAFAWKVFMAGDSHVCSKIYPRGVEAVLCREEPDVEFSYYGKIGAGFYTYNDSPSMMREIYDAEPDILIVHLGTNDSYTKRFSRKDFLHNVSVFHKAVAARLPECKIVFVTPFYNRLRGSGSPNRNTRRCADALLDYAAGFSELFVVDNNASHGMYFLDHRSTLMRPDCVHLTEKGYEELARQVGEALADMEDLWIICPPPYLGDGGDTAGEASDR